MIDPWPPAALGPPSRPIVWNVDLGLGGAALRAAQRVLSSEEKRRHARFVRPIDRDRYAASHAALRFILGQALDADPAALTFALGPSGKPEAGTGWPRRLHFNLSHSGARALVGVSPTARIGVDVEAMRPLDDALRIARAHFDKTEVAALEALPTEAVEPAFFALWTCKEAVVKALGAGLAMPLDRFAVTVPPQPAAILRIDDEATRREDWSLHRLAPGLGYAGAAAIEGGGGCDLVRLPADWIDALGNRP